MSAKSEVDNFQTVKLLWLFLTASRFYYITTWFLSKVRNWSIPHFCKTYGIGQFHTFDENWISFKKSVKSQHFFPKVWNWSIPHFWEIFSCFPYVLTSKPSILQRRVRGGSGGFISTLWFWILLLKKCEIEIIWKWYIGKSNTISYVVNSHQLYWNDWWHVTVSTCM